MSTNLKSLVLAGVLVAVLLGFVGYLMTGARARAVAAGVPLTSPDQSAPPVQVARPPAASARAARTAELPRPKTEGGRYFFAHRLGHLL